MQDVETENFRVYATPHPGNNIGNHTAEHNCHKHYDIRRVVDYDTQEFVCWEMIPDCGHYDTYIEYCPWCGIDLESQYETEFRAYFEVTGGIVETS